MGLRKEFKQWATTHCMYVWQHDLKVDTINVKQVTIFNDFVDSQFFSEPMHAIPSMSKPPNYDLWISQGNVATV